MESTIRSGKRHLLALPLELLVLVFQAQPTIKDALHLGETCAFLHGVCQSSLDIISEPIFRKEIPCYEEALRLVKTQVSNASRTLTPVNLAKEIYTVAEQANLILELAATRFQMLEHITDECAIHSGRPLMEHARLRILHSWYFIKLYAETYRPMQPGEQRQVLDIELSNMNIVQLYVLSEMMAFLCVHMKESIQEQLGIADPHPSEEAIEASINRDSWSFNETFKFPKWEDTRQNIKAMYSIKTRGRKWDKCLMDLYGPFDKCLYYDLKGRICEPRDPKKGLWEI